MFVAFGIVTHATHSQHYRQQKDCDIFIYRISSNSRHPRIVAAQSGALRKINAALEQQPFHHYIKEQYYLFVAFGIVTCGVVHS